MADVEIRVSPKYYIQAEVGAHCVSWQGLVPTHAGSKKE